MFLKGFLDLFRDVFAEVMKSLECFQFAKDAFSLVLCSKGE